MQTTNYSKAVQSEINAINEQQTSVTIKKRLNWELIGALLTIASIVLVIVLLDANGLIREF